MKLSLLLILKIRLALIVSDVCGGDGEKIEVDEPAVDYTPGRSVRGNQTPSTSDEVKISLQKK